MNDYMSDKEQVEMIKKWFKDYGLSILIAVVIGLGVGFGWRYWNQSKINHETLASALFQESLFANERGDVSVAAEKAEQLQTKFSSSPYATLATLVWAKNAVAHNNYSLALEKLNWVISNSKNASFREIARIRAARILSAQKQYDSASTILSKIEDKTYLPMIQQVQGDIYSAQGKTAEAQKSYQEAKKGFESANLQNPVVDMKS